MAVEIASAYVSLEPQFTGVQAAIARGLAPAGDAAGKTVSDGMQRSLGSRVAGVGLSVGKILGGGIAAAAATLGGIALSKGLDRALDLQDAQAKLTGLGHSASDVTAIMGNALASVKGTAFGLGDAATVAASAVAAGIKPGQDLTKYLSLTADAATIAGTSLGEMGGILNSVNANGTVYTGTLNQLSDRGIPVFQYLQKEYGVSADALSTMVSRGQVSAATLDKVLQEHLGGAALKSGNTARGAFDNVGAALGRLGASLIVGPVQAAPALFQAISGAVDRFSAALGPANATLSAFITAGMTRLTTAINGIDFTKVVAGIQSFIGQVKSLFAGGGGVDTSGLSAGVQGIATIAVQSGPVLKALGQSFGSISGAIANVLASGISALPPVLNAVAVVFQFLGQHAGIIVPLLAGVVGGMLLLKAASAVEIATDALLIPQKYAIVAANLILARSNLELANAQRVANGQQEVSAASLLFQGPRAAAAAIASGAGVIASLVAQGAAWVATAASATASAVAQGAVRVAQLAMAGATGVATAAQWLFNAALDANPIGIIIVAIAALVAGLIYFFTQTQLGRAVFADVVAFIQGAIGGLVSFFQTVFGAIGSFLSQYGLVILAAVAPIIGIPILIATHWSQIVTVVQAVFGAVIAFISGAIANVVNAIQAGLGFVVAIIQFDVNLWRSIFTAVWTAIVSVVTGAVNTVRSIITTVFAAIVTVFNLYVNAWRTVIVTVWNAITSFVTGAVNTLKSVISTGLNVIRSVVQSVFSAVASFVSSTWNTIVSFITSAVSRVRSAVSAGFNAVASAVSSALNSARSTVTSIMSAIASAVSSGIGRVVGFFSGLGGKITSALGAIAGQALSAGAHIVGQLVQGLLSGLGAIGSAAAQIAQKVKDALPHSPAKEGPFSGSGWTAVRTAGEAITNQFAAGLHLDTVLQQDVFSKLTAPLSSSIRVAGGTSADLATATAGQGTNFNYYAAPNQSFDAKQDLWDAIRRKGFVTGKPMTPTP